MPQILFKGEFLDAIRQGRKTTTLRRWKSCRVKPGDRVRVRKVGLLRITDCSRIMLKDITPADAQADGFRGLKELRAALRKFYPNPKGDGRQWYRIAFALDEPPQVKHLNRERLAGRIRAELDKAVHRSEVLSPL